MNLYKLTQYAKNGKRYSMTIDPPTIDSRVTILFMNILFNNHNASLISSKSINHVNDCVNTILQYQHFSPYCRDAIQQCNPWMNKYIHHVYCIVSISSKTSLAYDMQIAIPPSGDESLFKYLNLFNLGISRDLVLSSIWLYDAAFLLKSQPSTR